MSQQLTAVVARYCDDVQRLRELLQQLTPAVTAAVCATAAAQQSEAQKLAEGEQQLSQRQQQKEENREGQSDKETQSLTPLDVAQLQICLGFAAVSLYHSYLKTQGQNVEKHPIVRDLARVRAYMKKVAARVDEERKGRSTSAVAAARRSFSVNAAAAKRVFQFYSRQRPAS